MKVSPNQKQVIIFLAVSMLVFLFHNNCMAQEKNQLMRIVELEIDSAHLSAFNAALKEDIETAVRTEPGVLILHAVYDKVVPTHVTIFEVYSREDAHKSHQQTQHFLKYRIATKDMVKSVKRQEVLPIAIEAKAKF